MSESSLQSLWPALSPQKRDALVAKIKGWKIEWWEKASGGTFPVVIADENGGCMRVCDQFSNSWAKAGPLLEEMLAADCEVRMQPATEKSVWADHGQPALLVAQKTAATIVATGASWPERIALAYCLWAGFQP